MIDLSIWKKRILEAITLASQENQPVLLSEIIRVEDGNPLSFFLNCKAAFEGERFFWRDPNRPFVLASAGKAYSMENSTQRDRYNRVEKQWNHLLRCAQKNGEIVQGTGPLLFGAFSFDPQKSKTALWRQFSDTHFFVPVYVVTQNAENTYLTINIVVEPHSSIEEIPIPDVDFISELLTAPKRDIDTTRTRIIQVTEIQKEEWLHCVHHAIEQIQQNALEKVVLAREEKVETDQHVSPDTIIPDLCNTQENSYIFVLESGANCFIGASPERLVRQEGSRLYSTCLAGSTRRGQTTDEDERLGKELLQSTKNRKEHQFVVEMIESAFATECTVLERPSEPTLMKLTHIQHLCTPIAGESKGKTSLLRLVDKLHPTPALGGSPKETALAYIREFEPLDRGLFGAPIGWMDSAGNGEFIVAIRSALICDTVATVFAGCGIVADSEAEEEFQETKVKVKPMLSVLGGTDRE